MDIKNRNFFNLQGSKKDIGNSPEFVTRAKNTLPYVFEGRAAGTKTITYPITYHHTKVCHPKSETLEDLRVLNDHSTKPVMNSYKTLRTQVLKKLSQNQWNSIAVITARSNQGASLTAVNLGISIAREHRYTCAVTDFNLKNPAIHKYFGYKTPIDSGVSDLLQGRATIPDVLVNPSIEGLVFLPGREEVLHSSELLMSPNVQKTIDDLRTYYASRVVIFDLPPILEEDDALAFLGQADACLVVIQEGVTERDDLQKMSDLLGDTPILGVVYNNSRSGI